MYSNPATKPLLRLLLPLLIGCIVYLMILLSFDTVQNVLNGFFNKELLVCIGMSYLLLESNRVLVLLFRKKLQKGEQLLFWTLMIVVAALILTFVLITVSLVLYFFQIENLSSIKSFATELRIFNAIFMFVTLLYHGYFLGFFWLQKQFREMVTREELKNEQLDQKIQQFHYMLHPDFLLSGLESVLLKLKENHLESADEGILLLSGIYQYFLKQQKELVSIKEEMMIVAKVENFLHHFSPYKISLQVSITDQSRLIIPLTLIRLMEAVACSQLSSPQAPLNISLEQTESYLLLSFPSSFSLIHGARLYQMLEQLHLQHQWLGRDFHWVANDYFKIYIPHVIIESEDEEYQESTVTSTQKPKSLKQQSAQ